MLCNLEDLINKINKIKNKKPYTRYSLTRTEGRQISETNSNSGMLDSGITDGLALLLDVENVCYSRISFGRRSFVVSSWDRVACYSHAET